MLTFAKNLNLSKASIKSEICIATNFLRSTISNTLSPRFAEYFIKVHESIDRSISFELLTERWRYNFSPRLSTSIRYTIATKWNILSRFSRLCNFEQWTLENHMDGQKRIIKIDSRINDEKTKGVPNRLFVLWLGLTF